MHIVAKRLTKWMVRSASVFLPEARAHDLERWRRGREDYWKFRRCDYVFASYGKSGRTWVRVMISRYFQLAHGLPDGILLGFDNFHKLDSSVPKTMRLRRAKAANGARAMAQKMSRLRKRSLFFHQK
jgi:hypothetical protein